MYQKRNMSFHLHSVFSAQSKSTVVNFASFFFFFLSSAKETSPRIIEPHVEGTVSPSPLPHPHPHTHTHLPSFLPFLSLVFFFCLFVKKKSEKSTRSDRRNIGGKKEKKEETETHSQSI